MWEFLRMRLGRPVGVVSITSSAARSTGTVNDGAGRRLVVSLLRLGLNRAPVRLLSSPYILLSVGRCRYVSGAPRLGGRESCACWCWGSGFLAQGADSGSGAGIWGAPAVWCWDLGIRASRAPRKRGHHRGAVGSSGLLWALVVG